MNWMGNNFSSHHSGLSGTTAVSTRFQGGVRTNGRKSLRAAYVVQVPRNNKSAQDYRMDRGDVHWRLERLSEGFHSLFMLCSLDCGLRFSEGSNSFNDFHQVTYVLHSWLDCEKRTASILVNRKAHDAGLITFFDSNRSGVRFLFYPTRLKPEPIGFKLVPVIGKRL